MISSSTMRLIVALTLLSTTALAWAPQPLSHRRITTSTTSNTNVGTNRRPFAIAATDSEEWSDFPPFDDEEEKKQPKKLGIDIGAMLDPLTDKETADLKAAAVEVINDTVAAGLDDIDRLRAQMTKEVDKQRVESVMQSELNAEREGKKLLNKIDKMTDAFLSTTASSRTSTKLAAEADQAAAGQGVEMGAWGVVGGASVATGSLLGSVSSAKTVPQEDSVAVQQENRIVVLADVDSDPYAKQLLEPLTASLKSELQQDLQVTVYKPTATVPLGGDNAATVLLFCTSFSDASSVNNALDRILRKTMQAGGAIAQPPTQIVAVSTVGTSRTNKMPYSMQNMMGGGKLEKRLQMEEAVIRTVRESRSGSSGLDYTICKLGELKQDCKDAFQFSSGDAFDGTLALDTAVTVLTEAIALQPSARNATLSVVGKLAADDDQQKVMDDAFLRLDGPELLRFDLASSEKDYEQLVEYTREWAFMLADSGKGLTTPIRAESVVAAATAGVERQAAVKVLFLPTTTGKNYLSKTEEKDGEKKAVAKPVPRNQKQSKDGGIEFLVEVTNENKLRVRAKRCNYGDAVIVKELSEETILSRFKKGIEVWKKSHQSS